MAVERQPGMKAGGSPAQAEANLKNFPSYLAEVKRELVLTTWPTREEAFRLTAVVLGVIVAIGFYMGALDYLFTQLVEKFSLLK